MRINLLTIFAFSFASFIIADVLTPRFGSNCAFTYEKIYCYGGKLESTQYDNGMYELDLKNLSLVQVSDMKNKWSSIIVNPSPGVPQDEYRYASQFVLLPDGSLFFDGGYNEDHPLVNKQVIYSPQKNTWTTLPNYAVHDGNSKQIYSAGAVFLPEDDGKIVFYGGRQMYPNRNFIYTSPNNKIFGNLTYETIAEHDPTKKIVVGIMGYSNLTELNVKSRNWRLLDSRPLVQNDFPDEISYLTATYHPNSKSIIFLGGLRRNEFLVGSTVPCDYYVIFRTSISKWEVQHVYGVDTPSPRLGHTATMLNTGNDILVYGGLYQNSNESVTENRMCVSTDYLFTLNLVEITWRFHKISSNSIGPRAFHSAVLINDTSLFIMFGKKKSDTNGLLVASNDIMVLNVTNLSSLVALDTYTNPTNVTFSSDTSTNNQFDEQSEGLSAGAIAGIVVGSVAVISIIAFAVFYHTKKKYKEEKMKELYVDWDVIDGGYREDPPFEGGFSVGSVNMSNAADSKMTKPDLSENLKTIIKPDVHEDLQTRIKPDDTKK